MVKETADGLMRIEMFWLRKKGFLVGYKSSSIIWTNEFAGSQDSIGITVSTMTNDSHVRLRYTLTNYEGEKKELNYKVPLATTPCNYGGKRYWFVCPLSKNDQYCGRRVGVLYRGGDYFGCRHCYDLTYESRKESRNIDLRPALSALVLEQKIHDLESQIKTRCYGGKPTRRQRKLDKLYQALEANYALL